MSGPRILEGRNRANAQEAGSFVDKFEDLEKQIDALKIEHMNKVRKIRGQQGELLDDAKSQGVPKKVVKAIADARKFERKAKERLDDLEDDDKSFAVDIRKALGDFSDLPLGAAAVDREQGDDTTSAIVDAVKASSTDEEWEKAGKKAAEVSA